MSQTIDVELTVNGENDVLVFKIDDKNPDMYSVCLNNDSNPSELKKVFSKLLEILLVNDIKLNFIVSKGYSRGLYIDVCSEYINELNKEILSVKEQINTALSE